MRTITRCYVRLIPAIFFATRWALRLMKAALVLAATGTAATAHPLGNFTINHFTRLEIGSQRIAVRYVVDMAEIPAFQELQSIGGDGAQLPAAAALAAY